MKKTFYILENRSSSLGQYLIDEEEVFLNPGCKVVLDRKPTNYTENIAMGVFRKEVPESKPVVVPASSAPAKVASSVGNKGSRSKKTARS